MFPRRRIISEIQRLFSFIDTIEDNKLSLVQFIKQTKSKVLDLAIRGKLVPQDSNDEPTIVLLERIKAERKTSKISSDISHYPFDVPENWVWCRLGEICSIKGGKRIPKGKTFSPHKTEHVYIRVSDMKNNSVLSDDLKYIDDQVYNIIKNYTISKDDLYLTIAGTIGSVGVIPIELDKMNLTENAAKLTDITINKTYQPIDF